MTDSNDKDKQLLKNIDRILTGQERQINEPTDEDTQTALELARKMASLREKPSNEFKNNLKAQLTHRLTEEERKISSPNQSFLFWEISRRRMWQGTIAALVVLAIMIIVWLIAVVFKTHS